MDNILGTILSQIDDKSLQVISSQANVTPDKAKNALASAIPILMSALASNSSTPQGITALQNAVARDHNGGLLDNLGALLGTQAVSNDGAGILKHVLGAKQTSVEQFISKDSGLDAAAVAKILQMAAPIVMGFLGKQSGGGVNTNIIGGLLNSFLNSQKKQAPKSQSVIEQILGGKSGGNVVDLGLSILGNILKKK